MTSSGVEVVFELSTVRPNLARRAAGGSARSFAGCAIGCGVFARAASASALEALCGLNFAELDAGPGSRVPNALERRHAAMHRVYDVLYRRVLTVRARAPLSFPSFNTVHFPRSTHSSRRLPAHILRAVQAAY